MPIIGDNLLRNSQLTEMSERLIMSVNPNKILDLTNAFFDSCVLFAASDAGIFAKLDQLKQANCQTIADELKLNERGARLLLDGAVAIGLLNKTDDLYENAPEASAFLVPGKPGDLSKAIRYNRDVYPAWGSLRDFANTGAPVERPELHLGDDKDRTRTFVLSMHSRCLAIGQAVVPMLDFSKCEKLLDCGGGPGTYSALIAKRNPQINCTVLDLPAVVEIAGELIEEAGLSEQVKTLPGSYHETEFPKDQDAVNFFGVLHQESPAAILALFKRAFEALKPGGQINVLDMMTDATRTAPKFSALFAINMALTTNNGWVFSDADVKSWLEEAGFIDVDVSPLPAPMPHWLATAKKPS